MFEKLDWKSRDDGVMYAEPYGLKYSYFIYPPNEDNQHYELAFIEDNGNYIEDYLTFQIQKEAIEAAEQHKNDILKKYITGT